MFNNVKVGPKLYFLVGFLSLLLIAIGVLGLRGMKTTDNSLQDMYRNQLLPVELLSEVKDLRRENMQEMLLMRVHDSLLPESKIHEADHPITKHSDIVETNRVRNERLWKAYMATKLTPEERQLADSYAAVRDKYRDEGQEPVMALIKERQFEEASLLMTRKLIPLFNETAQKLDALMQHHIEVASNEKNQANANYTRIRNLAIASIAGGILLALGTGFWIIRRMTVTVTELLETLSSTSAEIASTMKQHERIASQQTTAVTETVTTIDELGSSASQVAMQAESAANQTEEVLKLSEQGTVQIDRAGDAVAALKGQARQMADQIFHWSEQNKQISAIANLVGEIASNTNMLALNAAVEAARAGEYGKGFAVISIEIRKLADDSKKSALKISALISDIQKTANTTVMATEEGNKIIEEVAGLAKQNSDLMIGIATSAEVARQSSQQIMLNVKQQAAAISQVVAAMKSISTRAKETYAGIGQTKVATQTISELSGRIRQAF